MMAAALLAGCGPSPEDLYSGRLPERVDFNFHVKPILSDRCFACHGPDEAARKADLRLDTWEGAKAVIRPGSLRRSELFRRITSPDSAEMMPPRNSHLSLSDYDKAILARWIEQGAEWKPHWAFLPPQRAVPPAVNDARWPRGGIDRFVLARLEQEGLRPSPEADRARLIRRVTYDLTGLPPTPQEVQAFEQDASPEAYEKVVDRLLASPAYGERMASSWLDLARYADSHGYQDDGIRHMWRWRDWVIEAYNRNQRYDEFVTWQLAGDLLPNPSVEQILATGFNRNHAQTAEGGAVEEEFRVEYVADRTNTFGKAFLGLTMECARCHDHKYDPVSQKNYYELFSFFNSVNEKGLILIDGNAGPTLTLLEPEEERELARARAEAAERERALAEYVRRLSGTPLPSVRPDAERGMVAYFPLDEISDNRVANDVPGGSPGRVGDSTAVKQGKVAGALEVVGASDIVQVDGGAFAFERTDPFTLSAWVYLAGKVDYAPVLTRAQSFAEAHRGYELSLRGDRLFAALTHLRPSDEISVESVDPLPLRRWVHLALTYDGSSRARGLRIYVDGRQAPTRVEQDDLRRTIVKEKLGFQIGGQRIVDVRALEGARLDEVRVHDRALTPTEIGALAGLATLEQIRSRPPAEWSEQQRDDVRTYALQVHDREFARRFSALRDSRLAENEILSGADDVMVMRDLAAPRPTFVLDRGAYDAPKEPVTPATPASVLRFPEALPRNRLGLARWLFAPENPLTARVAVNRHWQMLFGTGLVKTADDFGNQGEIPSHPELLDYLAVTYRESGWDTKALLKRMVMSATYRQSSRTAPELRERDPENRLLARGPSHRLPVEMVRDGALAASGLLTRTVGGPSVKPYQPEGLWEEKSAGRGALAKYVQDHGEDLYRRGLYMLWKRSSPPPMLTTFDAADRNACTVTRQRTNTPLQALVLMNDPQFVEASRFLAERMMREGGATPDARLRFGFLLMTARDPSPKELGVLRSLFDQELAASEPKRAAALRLLAAGERPRDPKLDPAELAAYTVVGNTLLNLDESVTKR